ncbi:MAG: beta-glucosidase [Lachnospiraceae bacterium]|nr:beta-glucosidase [Lachnospiraceae bacterium]
MKSNVEDHVFPEGFVWGTATASYQVEGAVSEDGRGESIWDHFCRIPGKIRGNDDGNTAADSYHRYREDVAIMKSLGLKAYRFSVSWSRILPSGYGEVNRKGIEYYINLIDELLSAGIEPYVTLYHWDLPQNLQYEGGWANRAVIGHYLNYARILFEAFKGRVTHYMTLNEPWVASITGYGLGQMAPGYKDYSLALRAAHHMLLAHGKAVELFKENGYPGEIGIALNLSPRHPASEKREDIEAAWRNDGSCNRWFLDALKKGKYPEDMLTWYRNRGIDAPPVQEGDMESIMIPVDFLGINYYTIEHTEYDPSDYPLEIRLTTKNLPVTAYGWAVTPEGLTEILTRAYEEYGFKKIYVTENGASYPDIVSEDGKIRDPQRTDYISRHIKACKKALDRGVNLCGYFVWSFIDNFEWNTGYSNTFGLVYRDPESCDRTVKESGYFYQRIIKNNGISEEPYDE